MKQEIWKDVHSYEGYYKASNLGRIKRLPKTTLRPYRNSTRRHILNEKILNPTIIKNYYQVTLTKNKIRKSIKVHQLIAMAFLNHTPCGHTIEVDHINNNSLDNRLDNLQLLTSRQNNIKSAKLRKGKTSKYIGVFWNSYIGKWTAKIYLNGKQKYIGNFNCEYNAHLAYKNILKTII